ncbi:hypothetical protein FA95DRAFT_1562004 [Auriscalpium vulgare]|uniref:Uncharacterized protein n=1 Tax=Auriscalpium vulgare TaxID=40419 RepID=A0ACB8RLA6_9AGAM|nr:hypothetical protein FA95DRAFT_1562004 [Auriscalpium vulgare]
MWFRGATGVLGRHPCATLHLRTATASCSLLPPLLRVFQWRAASGAARLSRVFASVGTSQPPGVGVVTAYAPA